MSDLINRQEAIDEIRFYITEPDISDNETKIEGYNDGLEMAISILSILSSAESERKIGKWIYDGIRGRFPACKCSICGHYENADWALLQGANYCPNCGAEMRDER